MELHRLSVLAISAAAALLSLSCQSKPTPAAANESFESFPYASIFDRVTISYSRESTVHVVDGYVDVDGTLSAPGMPAVQVAGLSTGEIEAMLGSGPGPFEIFHDVHVAIIRGEPYYVIDGEVAHAGRQPLEHGLKLGEAITRAAPISPSADVQHVTLIRTLHIEQSPHVTDLGMNFTSPLDTVLIPGDRIFVPAIPAPLPELRDVSPRVRIVSAQR